MTESNRMSPRDFLAIAAVVFAIVVSLLGACVVIADTPAHGERHAARLAMA